MNTLNRFILAALIGWAVAAPAFGQTKKPSIWDKPNIWEPLTPFDAPPIITMPDDNPLSFTNNLGQSGLMVRPEDQIFARTNWPCCKTVYRHFPAR